MNNTSGGLNEELTALSSRRLQAETEIRTALYRWMLDHCDTQTIGDIKRLSEEMCMITARAVLDVYNLPRPPNLPGND